MSSDSPLDTEELENVPLVRMEDVQPDRSGEKVSIAYKDDDSVTHCNQDDNLETFIVEGSELHCIVDNDDSNIGSMVSVHTHYEENELIIPDVLESNQLVEHVEEVLIENDLPKSLLMHKVTPKSTLAQKIDIVKPPGTDSWPTLEILPGGVINLADKTDYTDPLANDKDSNNVGNMIYACAKCSQGFKYLFCLVKHVRWHEVEAQKLKIPVKLTPIEKKIADLQERGEEMDKIIWNQRGIVEIQNEPLRKLTNQTVDKLKEKYICLHSGKRKIIQKPRVRKTPKKS